jgi:hypothetical protein
VTPARLEAVIARALNAAEHRKALATAVVKRSPAERWLLARPVNNNVARTVAQKGQ